MKSKILNVAILIISIIMGLTNKLLSQNNTIIGTWVSETDNNLKFVFKQDNKCYQYSKGVLIETDVFLLSNTSPQCGQDVIVTSNTNYLQLTNTEDETDIVCYEIYGLTEKTLTIRSINRAGFTLFLRDEQICDPASPSYDPLNCIEPTVEAYFDFNALLDKSLYNNTLTLQDESTITDGKLILAGGSPWDYMHPHATVANSPSLNPQYITVAARLKTQDFYGCGNDAIVNKPFTSHTAPYYQYHLGICGTYCGGGGYYFSFACSINGVGQGMYSTPNVWVPDQWYTVIGTYDGSTMKLFVNGALVASKAVTGTIDSFDTDEFIGKHGNVDYSIPAEIDWVKVYNRALTDTEVAALGQ